MCRCQGLPHSFFHSSAYWPTRQTGIMFFSCNLIFILSMLVKYFPLERRKWVSFFGLNLEGILTFLWYLLTCTLLLSTYHLSALPLCKLNSFRDFLVWCWWRGKEWFLPSGNCSIDGESRQTYIGKHTVRLCGFRNKCCSLAAVGGLLAGNTDRLGLSYPTISLFYVWQSLFCTVEANTTIIFVSQIYSNKN